MARTPSRSPKSPLAPAQAHQDVSTEVRGAVPPDPEDVARYIESFTLELSSLARRSQLDFLAYLLDMARMEAERIGTAR